jgi:hypothetical protein
MRAHAGCYIMMLAHHGDAMMPCIDRSRADAHAVRMTTAQKFFCAHDAKKKFLRCMPRMHQRTP